MKRTIGEIGLVAFVAVALSACVTERSPIDQTDRLGLDKRLFEGEWFYKQTVVDLPYSIDWSFVGETNELKIIRWEITENWLIAYSVHQKIEYTDTEGTPRPSNVPIMALPILAHFDRQLAQNPTTGEDLPMLVENTDKPWWQRRYFVVDPAGSPLTNFELQYLNITIDLDNPFNYEPLSGYRQVEFHDKTGKAINPLDYELRHMAGEEQLAETFSFHTTTVVSANNNWDHIWTWDDVNEFINWEPARIEMRHFFWRVDRDAIAQNGFHAMEFQDEMFRRFGYFVREYRGVDPQHGYRENYTHMWANHFNISGDNKIVYYLGPNFPKRLELTACSIGADYNHAFSKAAYEGKQAEDAGKGGFVSDFPEQVKLADGLNLIPVGGSAQKTNVPTSAFMPDATGVWPDDLKLDDGKYYYIDYALESLKAPQGWAEGDKETFADRQAAMVEEYRRYCFAEGPEDKFVLRRNAFLEYDYERDGVNPEGLPNLITPNEIVARYGEDIDSRVAKPVTYPVACKVTLEHRCAVDANGHKVARWEAELGDPRKSFIYWVETPTEYGILGVAQWSDNPETGQIFAGVGHIAGSVLQWSVSRELERYFMLKEQIPDDENDQLHPFEFDSAEHYQNMLDALIIDAEYTRVPQPGEDDARPGDEVNPPPPLAPGSEQWRLSAVHNPRIFGHNHDLDVNEELAPINEAELTHEQKMKLEKVRLPQYANRFDISKIQGTKWETLMSSKGLLDSLFPGETSYSEDQLYQISPVYWGTMDAMKEQMRRETLFTEKCYFQSEWLDGGFLEIIKNMDDEGYTREDIRRLVERVMFKGVAEHEVGHSIGLRHNFIASADELNYVGSDGAAKTGYWRFKGEFQAAFDEAVKQYAAKKGKDVKEISATEKFYLSKTIPTPKDWYMYSSVMDYMDEFYFHGFGLGRYDLAAILYVYGKAVEKYRYDEGSHELAYHPITGNPIQVVEPMYETHTCGNALKGVKLDPEDPDVDYSQIDVSDLYNAECACVPGAPKPGERDEDCVCVDYPGLSYCYNAAKQVQTLRTEVEVELVENGGGKLKIMPVENSRTPIQLNGDVRPYLYCPDHWRFDHAMCIVWDKGYTAREIVRNMADQYKRFYVWRNFRRGNPRFREVSWFSYLMTYFPFVHFTLDFNYNRFKIDDWLPLVLDSNENPFPVDSNGRPQAIPLARKEYLLAINGVEEWEEMVSGQRVRKTLTPGGPGDYLIASMEALNFMVYDVMYSPDVGLHVLDNWFSDRNKEMFKTNPYILPDEDLREMEGFETVDIDLRFGHFHRDAYNRQDDLGITQTKLMRRGFTLQKDAVSYMLTNAGWPVEKYAFENMANAYYYTSDGIENALYHMMADIMNEDALFTFSRYCATKGDDGEYEVKVFQPRLNELYLWNWDEDAVALNSAWQPGKSDSTKTMCQKLSEQEGKKYTPIHGSWVYFDKIWPALFGTVNLANTMADNTVFWYFTTDVIPVAERGNWTDPDGVNEVECLNSKENLYYRARKFPGDPTENAIFDLVKRCYETQKKCLLRPSMPMAPGNLRQDQCLGANGYWYPKSYINRELETIESTFILLNDFSSFWLGTITGNYR
ncbi:MAG: hypothetical protein C4523_09360 [Myxococcales bacterium]|nr:MAG: hypothetical protein C4523_09360 [Myxococcales bacterium]